MAVSGKMKRQRFSVMVNAIPLRNIGTGIGRYLKCLYTSLETLYGERLDLRYFDGQSVLPRLPTGPSDPDRWCLTTNLFWRLPPLVAVLLRMALQLRRELAFRRAARDIDLYHEPGFFPFRDSSQYKTVFTIYDLSFLDVPHFHPPERVLFSRLFFRKRCCKVDHFLTISEFTRKAVEALLGPLKNRITVTPLAHDPTIFYRRTSRAVKAVRESYRLPEQYFLFVGASDPRKNLRVILEALTRSGLRVPLAAVGWRGWSKIDHFDDRVLLLGYVPDDDLAGLYSGALALVFPSLYEGFGLPILEAMACGCPVICSRSSSLPEVAGGAAMYLEDPHDSQALAFLLKALADSLALYGELSQKGRNQASHFSWEATARRTFEVFESLL
jgi:glycosyltransferase involved in cell wall biosynthesis